jgi:hypothetical protein
VHESGSDAFAAEKMSERPARYVRFEQDAVRAGHATRRGGFMIGEPNRQSDGVSDEEVDAELSERFRLVSRRFWTPVAVARTAARWMEEIGARNALDIGAGAGKFCVVAALTSELRLVGIEQRFPLVVEASRLARRFRVEQRCRVLPGTIERVDVTRFDAVYVFNSFAENIYPPHERLDDTVELSPRRLRDDLLTLEHGLARMAVGAAFVTYHGFGGRIPDTFDLVRDEPAGTGELRLWVKRRRESRGSIWIEVADDVILVQQSSVDR